MTMRKIVLFIMAFLACLSVQAQGMHWTPVDEGLYSGSTTVIAVVQVNGVEQSSTEMELAVFCGEECRGTAYTTEFPITHRFLAMVNVYGEVGHELSFKAYDHATDQELEMDPVVTVTFTEDGSGTLIAPLELNFSQQVVVGNITFADSEVKALCVANWDTNGDGELSYAEAAVVTDLRDVFYFKTAITSFNELQYFNGLTSINSSAFSDCWNLTAITIPLMVTSIENFAFFDCFKLSSISISNSVVSIGNSAFFGCGLTSIVIPASVTSIGNKAFGTCSSLAQIIVETGNSEYDSRDNCNAIISTTTNTLIVGCKNTTIPRTVTSIGEEAFNGCGLISVTIPISVASIGIRAFGSCSSLAQIVVESGNTVFDSRDNCNAIINTATNTLIVGCKNTTIPNTITAIGDCAFWFCRNLTSITIPSSVVSIGSWAFNSCGNLTSITIPSSVESIGSYAFLSCGSLTSIISMTQNPAVLGDYAFNYVNKSIPVYVPCGTVATYQAASGWSEFTNYQELECPSYEITATANPAEGGTITGAGSFAQDETCTLTATANEDYAFVNWTEAGTSVSTDPTYSFVVTENRTLVANFEFTGPDTPHWTPIDEGLYSGSTTIIAVVKINGVEQYSDQIELGVFCGEECRGTAMTGEFFLTHRYLAQVNVYGENGNQLTFKAYDHAAHQELEMDPVVTVPFSEDGNGTLLAPLELNFASTNTTVTQTTTLIGEAWNRFSISIEVEDPFTMLDMLKAQLGENGMIIESVRSSTEYYGDDFWFGDLDYEGVNNEEMYLILVSDDCTVELQGMPANSADHPITILPEAWTRIGFPCSEPMSVEDAMVNFEAEEGDFIESKDGSVYYYEGIGWFGDFDEFTPGEGYLYYSVSTVARTLVFEK